jgi:autoinducer 2-degrading protein
MLQPSRLFCIHILSSADSFDSAFVPATCTIADTTVYETIMATRYCLNVRLCLKSERVEEFLRLMRHDQRETLTKEPGCRQFELGRSVSDPCQFFLHEEYDDIAAFQAHTQTPHYAEWQQFVQSDPFTSDIVADFYETIPPLVGTA